MTRSSISLAVLGMAVAGLLVLAPSVFFYVFAGILFAVFLRSGGGWIARRTGLAHGWGIGIFSFLFVAFFAAAGLAFAPAVTEQATEFARQIPEALGTVRNWLEQYPWGQRLLDRITPEALLSAEGGSAATAALGGTFGALGNLVIVLFIGLYGAVDPGTYRAGLRALVAPPLRPRADEVLDELGDVLSSWLGAQFIAMAVVGVLTWLGLWALSIPLALLLGLMAAILAFIPNIGPVIAAVPGLLLAIPEGATTVALVLGVYVAVQTLESYVVTPLLQQERVSLPPAFVIAMQVLFGVLFGLIGLALATPLAAVAMTLAREVYVKDYLEAGPGPSDAGADPSRRTM